MQDLTEDDLFVCTDEPEEIDDEIREALVRAREDVDAGRVYTMDQARERVASWRTRFYLPKPH